MLRRTCMRSGLMATPNSNSAGLREPYGSPKTMGYVLATCEHILDSLGATGPIARQITRLFNISTAASKVIHCTLHNYHVEGKDLDSAYAEFKRRHCDLCPDRKPRPEGWRGTEEEIQKIHSFHSSFVANLAGTPNGFRRTNED